MCYEDAMYTDNPISKIGINLNFEIHFQKIFSVLKIRIQATNSNQGFQRTELSCYKKSVSMKVKKHTYIFKNMPVSRYS